MGLIVLWKDLKSYHGGLRPKSYGFLLSAQKKTPLEKLMGTPDFPAPSVLLRIHVHSSSLSSPRPAGAPMLSNGSLFYWWFEFNSQYFPPVIAAKWLWVTVHRDASYPLHSGVHQKGRIQFGAAFSCVLAATEGRTCVFVPATMDRLSKNERHGLLNYLFQTQNKV